MIENFDPNIGILASLNCIKTNPLKPSICIPDLTYNSKEYEKL